MNDELRVGALRRAALERLAGLSAFDPQRLADDLISGVLDVPRLSLPACLADTVSVDQAQKITKVIDRVAAGEPPQYALGFAEFMGHRFQVDKRVLIPRPETEQLVELVLEDCPPTGRLVDCGTGSGCIAVSMAIARPDLLVTAVDLSLDALSLARENAMLHHCADRITFREGDLLKGIDGADIVVANLPYVSEAEYAELEPHVKTCEPKLALIAEEDGLALIRNLIGQAATVLPGGGRIVLEFGAEQGSAVRDDLEQAGFKEIRILQDYQGHDRMASAKAGG